MSLRDRLTRRTNGGVTPAIAAPADPATDGSQPGSLTRPTPVPRMTPTQPSSGIYGRRIEVEPVSAIDQVKIDLHRKLIERLDLEALEQIPDERLLNSEIRAVVIDLLREESTPLTVADREDIIEQVLYEITGLGPIEPMFRDLSISDILVNGSKEIYIERGGRLTRVATSFRNDAHLMAVIDRIVSRVGRRVDESSPMVDARLPDGSRVNAIIPPLALDGAVLSIRRFAVVPYTMGDLVNFGTVAPFMAEVLMALVRARMNLLISGGTGTGKTTLLNVISGAIPPEERIVTIEDAAELQLQQPHVVRLETRPPNIEGKGEVTQRALVRNTLRMRPDRIVLGEVRGPEVLDMLQAMNTGHDGSMTTLHANSPRDALTRLEHMLAMAGVQAPPRTL